MSCYDYKHFLGLNPPLNFTLFLDCLCLVAATDDVLGDMIYMATWPSRSNTIEHVQLHQRRNKI